MLDDQTLVSVVLITEDAPDDDVFNTFKNITEQTHRKIDIIRERRLKYMTDKDEYGFLDERTRTSLMELSNLYQIYV